MAKEITRALYTCLKFEHHSNTIRIQSRTQLEHYAVSLVALWKNNSQTERISKLMWSRKKTRAIISTCVRSKNYNQRYNQNAIDGREAGVEIKLEVFIKFGNYELKSIKKLNDCDDRKIWEKHIHFRDGKSSSNAVQMLLHLSRSLLIKLWLVRSTAFFAADAWPLLQHFNLPNLSVSGIVLIESPSDNRFNSSRYMAMATQVTIQYVSDEP